MCQEAGCTTRPNYNHTGSKHAVFCGKHKEDGMVDVKSKVCEFDGCKTRPTYNHTGSKHALFCVKHKEDGMVDVTSKTCKSDWCSTRFSDKYNGYCVFCYIHLFPDKPISRNYKTKEQAVVDHVKTNHSDLTWIADKRIQGGCSRRRPDLLLDLGDQCIIVEVDENQHIEYDCSCENKRIMELSQDVGHVPIIFIRFNPDEYEQDGKKVSSCWGYTKGLCGLKKSKRIEWTNRLNALDTMIHYWVNHKTDKLIETIELFYNTVYGGR